MTRLTGSSSFFIEDPGADCAVVDWFRHLPQPPEETPTADGVVLYFRSFGSLTYDDAGSINVALSPVVTIARPTRRRMVLWTVGEVNFLSTLSLPQNKPLRNVSRAFTKWLKGHQLVYDQSPRADNPFAYYIEGTAKNWGDIYALPSGLEHLQRGGYVVSARDNEFVVDRVCKMLRLRGVDCSPVNGS